MAARDAAPANALSAGDSSTATPQNTPKSRIDGKRKGSGMNRCNSHADSAALAQSFANTATRNPMLASGGTFVSRRIGKVLSSSNHHQERRTHSKAHSNT